MDYRPVPEPPSVHEVGEYQLADDRLVHDAQARMIRKREGFWEFSVGVQSYAAEIDRRRKPGPSRAPAARTHAAREIPAGVEATTENISRRIARLCKRLQGR